MLEIAFDELPGRSPQQVLSRHLRPRHRQRHDILELVAKGYGSAVLSPRAASMAPPHFHLGIRPIIDPPLEISLSLSTSLRAPDTQLRQRAARIVETVSRSVLGERSSATADNSVKSKTLKRVA